MRKILIPNHILLLLFFFIFSLTGVSGQSQTVTRITGVVLDSLENIPIAGATATLYSSKDSSLIKGVLVTNDGQFVFNNITPAPYFLSVTFLGYTPQSILLPSNRFTGVGVINLGNIKLNVADYNLATVEVVAELPELVVKEDTLEYNASAFKTAEGAVVEDLLKRLPGVEVDQE